MRTAAVALILSMLCGALLTPIVRTLSHRFGLLDHGLSSRKIHGRPIPRLGGIAIVVGFYVPLLGLLFLQSSVGSMFFAEPRLAIGLVVGGLMIASLGVYDDLRGAGAGKKFAVQFLVAGTMYYLGFRVDALANPFGTPFQLGPAALPMTLLWIVGVINAMNLIDGLDGLAGGVALIAVSTILLISVHRNQPLMILFCAALAGSIIGFLFYNFNPASIFMGDTGSMFLGFVLATSSIRSGQKASTAVTAVIPIIILGFPILDTLLAMSRRAIRGRPLFRADKEHIHHRLLGLGFSQRQAVLVLYGICVLLAGVALIITFTESTGITSFLIVGLSATVFLFLRRLGYVRFDVNQLLSDQRRRNRAFRTSLRPYIERLRHAASTEEIWTAVRQASAIFDASGVSLRLAGKSDRDRPTTLTVFTSGFTDGDDPTSGIFFRARFSLGGENEDEGTLELGWRDGRSELDRDLEIAIELFCGSISEASDRIRARLRWSARARAKGRFTHLSG